MTRPRLPIDDVLPRLREVLATAGRAVLQAPPGAGKTTAVPLALVDAPWMAGGRIVMLEPRRLAARAAARRMATLTGGRVGDLVGFRVRGESVTGPATRIEVVTEGVLTRMLATDPTLDGVSAVIFDEFHERSLVADTGLALTLRTAELVRPDLRLLVMSATMDGAAVAALLGNAPQVTAEGRAFPVETRWIPQPARGTPSRPLDRVAAAVRRAVEETDGDVLVFLPGVGEIRRIASALGGAWPAGDVRVYGLHGSMSPEEQDAAIAPSPPGRRKVVLATSVAETSLTIEGVGAVVDSGYARVPRFDVRSGMTRLETVRVTKDAADQRRGRAGRTASGVCYRLWSGGEHAALLAHRTPEMLSADLAPLALDLALAGVDDAASLRWLDVPPAAALAQARELLTSLDALDVSGAPTSHGKRMASLGVHPRIAHLVLRGRDAGLARLASEIAALLGERDILTRDARGTDELDPDLSLRIAVLRNDEDIGMATADRGRVMRAREEARRIRERLRSLGGATPAPVPDGSDVARAGELLALAYPDRVALARAGASAGTSAGTSTIAGANTRHAGFRMRNGRGARVSDTSPLARASALAIADTDGARDDARVYLAAPIAPADIERLFGTQILSSETVALDDRTGVVTRTVRRTLGALVLDEHSSPARDADAIAAALLQRVRANGVSTIPWNDTARGVRERMAFLRALDTRWPEVGDAALTERMDEWLAPLLATGPGVRRWSDFERADLGAALLRLAPPSLRGQLDALAPTHVTVATGSRIPVDYSDPRAPVLAVRLQELFGTDTTPAVGGGRVPLTLHLLSPAGRPLQVTRDLVGFWRGSYADVRKEMRGRYPRHPWPDDPLAAPPTRCAKPR